MIVGFSSVLQMKRKRAVAKKIEHKRSLCSFEDTF